MVSFKEHFELMERLAQEPRIIQSPDLWNVNDSSLYAALMDELAQPLPTGEESPFSNKAPGSAHALLMGAMVHLLGLYGYELNLLPDSSWVKFFQLLGVEPEPAAYPVINIVFYRSADAIASNLPAEIPYGTEIRSNVDPTLSCYTLYTVRIDGKNETATIPARLNRAGKVPNLRRGEFNNLPRLLSLVERAENNGVIVSEGAEPETLAKSMLRAREGIRTGSLGKVTVQDAISEDTFLGRCVTPRDWAFYAKMFGAQKVNVVGNIQYGSEGTFRDLTTIVLHPAEIVSLVSPVMEKLSLADGRISVIGSEIIPLTGRITVRALPELTNSQVFDLAAIAIRDNINPPNGKWGDPDFVTSLAKAIEQSEGIYATININLKDAFSNTPLSEIDVKPWHLFEIQSSLEVNIQR